MMIRVFGGLALAVALTGAAGPSQDAPASATVARPPLPVEAFAALPQLERPRLSPNGKKIVGRIAVEGRLFLAIATPGDGKPPQLVNPGDVDLNWWRWVNDEWIIVGVGQEVPVHGESLYTTRAIGIPLDGGKMVSLAGRSVAQLADDVIWTANDGSARVMLAYQTSVYSSEPGFWPIVEEIDLATGRRRVVEKGLTGVFNWYADGDGVVRMGIGMSEDGRSRRLLYRDHAVERYRTVDRARTDKAESLTVPVLFLRDRGKALAISNDEQGFSALYELDLATLERGRQLFASRGYDIGGLIKDGSGFGYLGVRVEEDRSEVRWSDPGMAAMQTRVSGQVKGASAQIASVSADRTAAIVRVGGADAPGAWFLYRDSAEAMQLLAQNNSTIGMRRMHPVRTIRYKARDGLEIAAVLTLPRGRNTNLPLIVMPHGGPFARDNESWDWWAQFLADRGYAVIQPNYRGSSGYGAEFARKGEGQWGLAMQDDLDDAIQALAALGIADRKRVCMVGASYGGYAAMRAAQRDGDKYRCAVSYAGVSDLNRMLKYRSNFLFAGARQDWLRKQAPDLKNVSPLNFPESFSIPILLMHGDDDRVVPPVHSRLMTQRLKAAGKDVTYIVQKKGDHHFSRGEDRLEFLKALEAFLAKHNPA